MLVEERSLKQLKSVQRSPSAVYLMCIGFCYERILERGVLLLCSEDNLAHFKMHLCDHLHFRKRHPLRILTVPGFLTKKYEILIVVFRSGVEELLKGRFGDFVRIYTD